ncbi:MAG TPA: DUF4185 domain-containing protein, partial [Pirellulales bacterium]|nr:DUF4185 domain-containing protein [Pirellulales bacterium]
MNDKHLERLRFWLGRPTFWFGRLPPGIPPLAGKLAPVAWLLALAVGAAAEAPPPLRVVDAAPLESLSRKFVQSSGWTGADGAYSIPISPKTALWIFDDTWIGRVENGRRAGARMINNTFAWQSLAADREPLRFFWQQQGDQPQAVLRPAEADSWYWPGDGAVVGERLYLLAKRVRKRDAGEPGFQFDWYANDLLEIANYTDEPTAWRWRRIALPFGKDAPQLSSACLAEGGFFYIYGLFPAARLARLSRPLAVARVAQNELAASNPPTWEFWSQQEQGGSWSASHERLATLFHDAAPEMTVNRVPGINGLVATYTSLGMSREIRLRVASRPEGPWSAAVLAYRCPEDSPKLLIYAAKAHPEQIATPGELVITYCCNTGSLAEHMSRPDIYL